jgi:hypothetical protein
LLPRRDPRIDFDGDLACRIDLEVLRDRGVQLLDLRCREIGRRSATPVILNETPAVLQFRAEHRDLALEVFEVARGDFALLGDDGHASAVRAARFAERQMNVQRQRLRNLAGRLSQTLAVRLLVELIGELDGRRIRRITRSRPVVLLQKRRGTAGTSTQAGLQGSGRR